mgnify:CR=1 FL=1
MIFPGSPSEAAFARLKSAPDNGPVRALANATAKMANELQLSREEAAKWKGGNGALSGAGGDFWIGVLAGRARAFSSGGTSAQPPYNHAGPAVRPGDELNGLLREQSKIRKQFAGSARQHRHRTRRWISQTGFVLGTAECR